MFDHFQTQLFVEKLPPNFAEIFGYHGNRRWVALFTDQETNFYQYFDGHECGPANQMAWDSFFSHPLIIAMNYEREMGYAKKRFEFGYSRNPPPHWLLLDCQDLQLYAGPKREVLKFLSNFIDQLPETRDTGTCNGPSRRRNRTSDLAHEGGAISMIQDMMAWLDRRLAELANQGKWPRIGSVDVF